MESQDCLSHAMYVRKIRATKTINGFVLLRTESLISLKIRRSFWTTPRPAAGRFICFTTFEQRCWMSLFRTDPVTAFSVVLGTQTSVRPPNHTFSLFDQSVSTHRDLFPPISLAHRFLPLCSTPLTIRDICWYFVRIHAIFDTFHGHITLSSTK